MGASSVLHSDTGKGVQPTFNIDVNNQRDILAQYKSGVENFGLMSDGFIRSTSGWASHSISVGLGDIAADSDALVYPLFRAKHDITVVSADIGVDTTVGADAVNYQTMYLEQTGSSVDLSTLTSAAGFTVKVPRNFASLDSGAVKIAAGQTLSLRFLKTASGKALSGAVVTISFTIDQARATIGDADDNVIRVVNDIGTAAVLLSDHTTRDHLVVKEKDVETFRIDLNGKMHGNAPDQFYYAVVNIGTIAAADSAAKKSILIKPHCTIEVQNVYFGANTAALADSDTAFMTCSVVDGSANVLVKGDIQGPYGGGLALAAGRLYDMGKINPEYAVITSSEQIQMEYLATGSPASIVGATVVVVYKKLD